MDMWLNLFTLVCEYIYVCIYIYICVCVCVFVCVCMEMLMELYIDVVSSVHRKSWWLSLYSIV